MTTFTPHVEILPAAQRRLWDEFRASLPASFVLYGGTALALRTASRQSEDFDFFTNAPVDAHTLQATCHFLAGAELIQAAPSTATFLVDRGGPVKVSWFGGLVLGRVGEPSVSSDTDVRVASLLDLAAQKVRVVQVRAERKDYLDLATLLAHGITLPLALGAATALYPDFAPLVSLKALSYFGDGDLADLPDAVKRTLSTAAERVRVIDDVPRLSDTLM
ncbi:MAG: nucleotidyl transferase AbiEii/AbiGii toxin family protein [Acidobacteria bacterium]|nr:nucleotidyl transferase AbiEii/AbiGii toxin family protein [Acidobacteriota bacterium]